ncbi:NRDE family protein [Patiriisocius hiemis]|uniref:NRDE family protein n=1 Tax=Patiriisocius hiemis TaxID=3075604 RepID=A0ABU2YF57_9FLAO|nr:NRDE family protein [Constantimarinum sp. W242]MDT0556511.1 NRDE family protein [Constantimarinum sp. W242]
MCTFTFLPTKEGFIATSNRDESPSRNTVFPKKYIENNTTLHYPKDALAGGTWIGLSSKKRLVCLLNGGFTTHTRKETYKMSRGIVVKDVLCANSDIKVLEEYDFNGVEPFTLLTINWSNSLQLLEIVWDGTTKHFSKKPNKPQIWSSSLLYSQDVKQKRRDWFSLFLTKNENPTSNELLDFHKSAGDGDIKTNLVMDRGFVKTKSITQVEKNGTTISMLYEDIGIKKTTLLSI